MYVKSFKICKCITLDSKYIYTILQKQEKKQQQKINGTTEILL